MAENNVKNTFIEDEMKEAYIEYAMSVIVGRALPDVRDGLKPVHRRILYAMDNMGMTFNKPFKKCARVIGECLAKFHPHGDTSVYDALVRMAQDFSLRYPLVDGQGNFGSIDGDSAAHYRYTECRLKKITSDFFEDIEKDTVLWNENFDNTLKEPVFLPTKIPNLLVNGSSGIAVGMATNIPPHNLGEVADAIIALIENPASDPTLIIQGPDFPTGGIILGRQGILNAYRTGRGSLKIRGRTEIEDGKIIITELPYQVNKAVLVESIATLVKDKKIEGISDLRDESSREGMRVVIKLSKGAEPEVVLNQLYTHTTLQSSFGIIFLALVNNEPVVLTLNQLLQNFISHRKDVIIKRTQFDLKKSEERLHILEGLKIALQNINEVIATIKKATNVEIAKQNLMSGFGLSELQSLAILDMKLQKLTGLEREKLENEYRDVLKFIEELKAILADEKMVYDIIKKETLEMKEKYGDKRRTEIQRGEYMNVATLDLIPEEKIVVTLSNRGYIKRDSIENYKIQRRGGVGTIGAKTKEDDFIRDLFISNTHDHILFFTNSGKVLWLRGYQVPQMGKQARGTALINILEVEPGENITSVISIKAFKEDQYLFMATKKGVVKKTLLSAYSNPRKGGIKAIILDEGDELIDVKLTSGSEKIVLGTKKGKAILFDEKDVRPLGRTSHGVRGIKLAENDEVVGLILQDHNKSVLTVSEKGYGKRTLFENYRQTRRGGKGIINLKVTAKNGPVIGIKGVHAEEGLIISTQNGMTVRIPVEQVSLIGRATQGVRLIRLRETDKVVGVEVVGKDEAQQIEVEEV